tara:strand:- start:76 stop:552 length:477 start_codon:yes stop_codon:yes gene_type:complete
MKFSNPRNNNKNRPFKRNNNHHRRQGDSNSGPKVSGNLTTVLEKYKNLAKDATSAGDYIAAENYLQHAEHFVRVLNERNSKNNGETKPPVFNGNGTSENNVVSDQQDSTSSNEPVDITKVLKPIPMDESTDSNENEEEIKVATPIKKKIVKKTAVSKK